MAELSLKIALIGSSDVLEPFPLYIVGSLNHSLPNDSNH